MKKLIVILALIVCQSTQAEDKILLGGYTPKQTLSLFKEVEGLELDVSSKDKKATISMQKAFNSDSILKVQVIGKFDSSDTSFANENGLSNDVTLKLTHTNIYYDSDQTLNNDIKFVEERTKERSHLNKKYYGCAVQHRPRKGGESEGDYQTNIKKEKLSVLINQIDCKNEYSAIQKFDKETDEYQFYRSYWYNSNSFSYSPGSHKYYDINSAKKESSDTETYELSSEIGMFELSGTSNSTWWDSRKFAFGVEYSKGDTSNESGKTNICKVKEDSPNYSTCFESYLLPAFENENLSLYGKYAFRRNNKAIIKGVDLTIKYTKRDKNFVDETKDVDTKRWSISLPVTLFVTKKYDVKAGLSFLWQEHLETDKENFDVFTVGLFVSKGFDLSGF
jgi:hypothetical protein